MYVVEFFGKMGSHNTKWMDQLRKQDTAVAEWKWRRNMVG